MITIPVNNPVQKIGLWSLNAMKCKEGDILHSYDFDSDFHILESGNASRKGRRYPRGEYCIEVCLRYRGAPKGGL